MKTDKSPSVIRYGLLTETKDNFQIPVGTTGERSSQPQNGFIRVNSDEESLEFFLNGKYRKAGSSLDIGGNITSGAVLPVGLISPVSRTGLSGDFEALLPPSPRRGDEVAIFDATGTFNGTHGVVIRRNGKKINSKTEDVRYTKTSSFISLRFVDDTTGWILITTPADLAAINQRIDQVNASFSSQLSNKVNKSELDFLVGESKQIEAQAGGLTELFRMSTGTLKVIVSYRSHTAGDGSGMVEGLFKAISDNDAMFTPVATMLSGDDNLILESSYQSGEFIISARVPSAGFINYKIIYHEGEEEYVD